MMEKQKQPCIDLPTPAQVAQERERLRRRSRYRRILCSTVSVLIVVAAAAVLLATLLLPVFRIYGKSMEPTLSSGDIVLSVKAGSAEAGDLIAFYYNNKILIKRVIACPGQWISIKEDGTVLVDGAVLEESYLSEKALGECDLTFPYQVPDERWFVLGDHRATSVDSRNETLGCVAEEQIAGRLILRLWPPHRITSLCG